MVYRTFQKRYQWTYFTLFYLAFTYQYNTRDTFGFAAKGAWFESDGKSYDIYKDPVTDDGTKKSLKGKVAVLKSDDTTVMFGFEQNLVPGEYYVKQQCTEEEENTGLLQLIYEDGKFFNQTTLTEVRERLKK